MTVLFIALVGLTLAGKVRVGKGQLAADPAPFLHECRIPDEVSNATFKVNLTESQRDSLFYEGRCFLACATEVYSDQAGMISYGLSNYWPYINDSAIDCGTAGNIHECTRGCLRRIGYQENLHTCTQHCRESCNMECDSLSVQCHPWIHSGCSITCDMNTFNAQHPCREGCDLFNHLLNQHYYGIRPLDPTDPPLLIPKQKPGHFSISVMDVVPQFGSGEMDDGTTNVHPVTFLFKFEVVNSSAVFYDWSVSPSVEVDLSTYACQDILVSFAVSNEARLSNFSNSTLITVHGDERLIPNVPTSIEFSEAADTRIGFFGHVILNITWESPENDAYLDNFTVSITSDVGENLTKCGSELWRQTIPKNTNFISVMASSFHALPVMTCRYNVQIHSVGPDGRSAPLEQIYTIQSIFDPDEIVFSCQRLWQTPAYVFWFNLTWMLPPYIRHGNVISNFVTVPELKEGSNTISVQIDNVTFPFQAENITIFTSILKPADHQMNTTYYQPLRSNDRVYYLKTFVTWNTSALLYVPSRHTYTCTESAQSPAPSHVENFTINSFFVNGSQISLDLDWSPPTIPNGKLAPYNICIGGAPLRSDQDPDNSPRHVCQSMSPGTRNEITTYFVQHDYLYVQIRAHNQYVPGNWSEPILLDIRSVEEEQRNNTDIFETTATSSKPATISSAGVVREVTTGERNVEMIVGVSVAGMVLAFLLICCLCLVFWYVKKLRQRKKIWRRMAQPCDPMFNSGPKNPFFEKSSVVCINAAQLMDDWEIPANEVIMEKLLGEGAFGEVYKGIIKCPIVNPRVPSSLRTSICTPVAIKLLKLSAKGNERQDFLSEIEMMKKVAEGQNPHVVCLVGCVTIQEPLCLITEFVKYGDLLSYLRTNRKMFIGSISEVEADAYIELGKVSPVDLISFAYQIASGMEYLSSLGIVHRDLACRNILVDEGKVLKISDLGMSRETDEIYVQKRTGRVPLKWMAIESIIAREFTSASDVWSYGVTLWEIGTLGGFPYPSISNEEFLPLLKRGYRMEKPDNCSPEVYDIMLMCWNELPQRRPTFGELRAKFDAMLLADRNEDYIDLRIDHSKLYYQLVTTALPTAEDKEYSPGPINKTQASTNLSASCSGLKSPSTFGSAGQVYSKQYLSDTDQGQALGGTACAHGGGEAERNARDRIYENTGRPVSMYLSRDQDKKDRENPYVDEPSSKMAAAALSLPNGGGANGRPAHWKSDGAIDLSPNECVMELQTRQPYQQQNGFGPEIKVTCSED